MTLVWLIMAQKIMKKTIRQKVIVAAKPVEVYEAFVDAKKHSAFTGSKATGEGKVGGKFTAWDGYISGKFLELDEGKKIVQELITTEWPEGYPPSRFELTLRKVKDGTEVSMVHSDVPAEQAEELREGWNEFYWKPPKAYFKELHKQKS
jgi:activator of HSP90 ATPase